MSEKKICKVDGCENSAHYKDWGKRGWCANHYALWRRHGDPTVMTKRPNGSGTITCGYKKIYVDGKQVLEHRYIIEQHLGRSLKSHPREVVHHINGNRLDNRIENLVVTSQSDHMRHWEYTRYRDDTHKQCSQCGEIKSRADFSRARTVGKDPHRPNCKACQNKYNMARLRRIAGKGTA